MKEYIHKRMHPLLNFGTDWSILIDWLTDSLRWRIIVWLHERNQTVFGRTSALGLKCPDEQNSPSPLVIKWNWPYDRKGCLIWMITELLLDRGIKSRDESWVLAREASLAKLQSRLVFARLTLVKRGEEGGNSLIEKLPPHPPPHFTFRDFHFLAAELSE